MSETSIVTSPFFDNKIQLFYEASLNRKNHTISLRIFNHRGVLKNRKLIELESDVVELFAAEEYLIGLDKNHQNVCIFDIKKHKNATVRGFIGQKNGFSLQMREKGLKFNFFIYDRVSNLILGLLDGHHIFYFRINRFDLDSDFEINQDLSEVVQTNKNISIQKIYTSSESINKMEIRNQRRSLKIQSQSDKPYILRSQNEPQQSLVDDSKNDLQNFSIICLLIKQKRFLRTIEMDWNNDKIVKVQDKSDVYDFCFRKSWDLIIKYLKNNSKEILKPESQKYEFQTKFQGHYNKEISLSDSHVIFCSQQGLFIIDPQLQAIEGVHNRLFFQVKDCQSIPKSIGYSNTVLMFQRSDELHNRFLFQVFDTATGQFNYTSIISPQFKSQQSIELELYLKKNIQKIYTHNAFIHEHFRQKVEKYLTKKIQQINADEAQIYEARLDQKNSTEMAKLFLELFIMENPILLNRLTFSLINSGLKGLFAAKPQHYSKPKNQGTSINLVKKACSKGADEVKQHIHFKSTLMERCNFDRWNQYFQQIIDNQYERLRDLFVSEGDHMSQNEDSEYPSNVESNLSDLYKELDMIKEKLKQISNVYNRFLNLIRTSSQTTFQNDSFRSILRDREQRIKENIKRSHSLFLIYDLFEQSKKIDKDATCSQHFERLQSAVGKVFVRFWQRKLENVSIFKRGQKYPTQPIDLKHKSSQLGSQALLLLHQHFGNARNLIVVEQQINFQKVLGHLILNLNEFQETAYFYYVIRNQLEVMRRDDLMICQDLQEIDVYPYMGRYLVNFLNVVTQIPLRPDTNWGKQTLNEWISKVQRASQLVLKLSTPSFTNYMIQLSSQYCLPSTLLKLVDSIPIEPYLPSNPNINAESNHKTQQVSSRLIYQERFIMKSLIFSGINLQTHNYSNTFRELIIYQMKRILLIGDILTSQENINQKLYTKRTLSLNQTNQLTNQPQKQNTPLSSEGTKLKNQLLKQFILLILSKTSNQNIRQIQELKNECLTLAEDKEFVDKIISQTLSKQNKKPQEKQPQNDKNQQKELESQNGQKKLQMKMQ